MAFEEGKVGEVRSSDDGIVVDGELTSSSALSGCGGSTRKYEKYYDGEELTAGQKDRRTARKAAKAVEEEQDYLGELRP